MKATEQRFISHIGDQGLSYATTEEYNFRYNLFKAHDRDLDLINAIPENTFTVGHNLFSTMTEAEKKRYRGKVASKNTEEVVFEEFAEPLEAEVDWRSRGGVNSVQDQGQCGSCWAFSATAANEGAHFVHSHQLLKLSESQLVDCDRNSGGCDGGDETYALKKYLHTHGQELERDYPYHARGSHCKFSSSKGRVRVSSVSMVHDKSASALRSSIQRGVTTMGVNAEDKRFHSYEGGILNVRDCKHEQDHAVAGVGYGSEGGQSYVVIRNSWRGDWGEHGYIRVSLDVGGYGVCGILMDASRPTSN
jgi:C1A family cysteine protease